MAKCATVGCKNQATHEMDYSLRNAFGQREEVTDAVCTPCAEEYTRRPTLRACVRLIEAKD